MSLTTDNVRPSPTPNSWHIGTLTVAGVGMGVCLLAFCTGVLAVGKFGLNLQIEALRTLTFVVLVFGSQATVYAIRERKHLWSSRPSTLLMVSSLADIAIAAILAIGGFAMTPLPATLVLGVLVAASAFAFILDLVKVPLLTYLRIAHSSPRHPAETADPGSLHHCQPDARV
jgi:H+-transporting ATPase